MKYENIELEFKNKFISERSMYEAWGNYVKEYIDNELKKICQNYWDIVKIPVMPRVKEVDSLLEKAFLRNKNYKNPYDDITDKVGVRYVVLIEKQIAILKDIITKANIWKASEDMDYKSRIEENPNLFIYQSVHYIVRNNKIITYKEKTIEINTPCEIQIRTLEQHAYAEVSHDTVYKKKHNTNAETLRLLARSMALNETADEIYGRLYDMIEEGKMKFRDFNKLFLKYSDFPMMNDKVNMSLYDSIESLIIKYDVQPENVKSFIESKKFLADKIERKSEIYMIYRQPCVYLIYYLAKNYNEQLRAVWELTDDMLEMIYNDLGQSF